MCKSEVAQLRQQILDEYEAMQRGLNGLALGTASHTFIDARMRKVDAYYARLSKQLGEQEASQIIYELYVQKMG
ncbi:MAG: hypothetical protein J2P37_13635 [Ktedonobacteraceae bacterium]|nr:hypothetical protein [Ktedonobacteraceae bacterium]MBO0791024.1 hypothetical protein [Ktedonobacteraceae bacterium]